jgi:hypothetical protein
MNINEEEKIKLKESVFIGFIKEIKQKVKEVKKQKPGKIAVRLNYDMYHYLKSDEFKEYYGEKYNIKINFNKMCHYVKDELMHHPVFDFSKKEFVYPNRDNSNLDLYDYEIVCLQQYDINNKMRLLAC